MLDEESRVLLSKKFIPEKDVREYGKLKSGELTNEVKKMILDVPDKEKTTIIVSENKLMTAIENLGIKVKSISRNKIEKLQSKKLELMIDSGFSKSIQESREQIREFAIRMTESKLRMLTGSRDLQVVEAIQSLDEIDKLLNIISGRVREWYGLHFPELNSLIEDTSTYNKIILEIGLRSGINRENLSKLGVNDEKAESIHLASVDSKGGDMREEDIKIISYLANEVIRVDTLRKEISEFIELIMNEIAPNLSTIAGPTIGARLIGKVGGLEKLSKLPSSTIQLLGAEKALFRSLKTGTRPPKHGILFQHHYVNSAPKWQRGKIARSLAGKIAIAARVDMFRGSRDKTLEVKIEERLKTISRDYPNPPEQHDKPSKTERELKYDKRKRRK